MANVLAANIPNAFTLLHVLPLMEDESKAQRFERSLGAHRIIVPSDLGGMLTVGFGSAHPSGDNGLVVTAPDGTMHEPDESGRVHVEIEAGQGGSRMWQANVNAPSGHYALFALFDELGFAREKDGTPLIPWNFWYWPFSVAWKELSAWGSSVLFPLQHYEEAFGVEGVLQWEKEHHNDPTGTEEIWEGHCHNAAPASVMFRPPPEDGVQHNGVHLTCEDLKLYATEFFALHGGLTEAWRLPGDGDRGRYGYLQACFPGSRPRKFGKHLVGFLGTLTAKMRDGGRALVMDLRDSSGVESLAVWNHAVYAYATRYWQVRADDLLSVEGRTTLFANQDDMDLEGKSSGLPARVGTIRGRLEPLPNETSVKRTYRFRVQFEKSGRLAEESANNQWLTAQAGSTQTFAPRYCLLVEPPILGIKLHTDGNLKIYAGDVRSVLSIRDKFDDG